VQKSAGNVLASIFWDQDGTGLVDYLPKGQIMDAEYYSFLLVQLKDILKKNISHEYHQEGLILARQCPGSPDTCNSEENGLPWLPMPCTRILLSESDPV